MLELSQHGGNDFKNEEKLLRPFECRSLVQTLLSSSHCGWGIGSLDQDAEEIHLLATYLRQNLNSKVHFHGHLLCSLLWSRKRFFSHLLPTEDWHANRALC